ncbi:NAD(P)/FAD-dependent oxidoreductase [Acuticoccus mangrovi]|uniref:FAD-dependent oxidoreductase n=1 Tax=Acuticoccus mangrovi TaxID=2796142 RepID=A0A934IR32_9HYPH|nr:FAD-dependent oxidoreductase [Acuticoccus mangrovi]MBJ3778547.1 FAD-dependent oxidoreductase [Acuticoccus mangrovi]
MKIRRIPELPEPQHTSWWLDEALEQEKGAPPAPALSGELTVDVVIVGGGFAGLWTAFLLSRKNPTLSIALIEAAICGSGASGKNGGMVSGYWARLRAMSTLFGDDNALAIARAGTRAQSEIREFASSCGTDLWWRDGGSLRISTHPQQDARIRDWLSEARRLGVEDTLVKLSPEELQTYCRSPKFRGAVKFAEGASVHPARLARALRKAMMAQGVKLYEQTPMTALERGTPSRITTPGGVVIARDVVLTINAGLAQCREFEAAIAQFSSYVAMTEPATEALQAVGWSGDYGMTDLRTFLRYARKTPTDRVLMGSGNGPIASGTDFTSDLLNRHEPTLQRTDRILGELVPGLADVGITKHWGGAVDVSSDRLPFFGTLPNSRIHYAAGFTGHGVNATHMAGQCLASFVLGEKNDWTSLALCNRELAKLPPEPFRTIGGRAVRWGLVSCEKAQEEGVTPSLAARVLAKMPEMLHLKIGTR